MKYDNQYEERPHGEVNGINRLYSYQDWLKSFRYQEHSLEQRRKELLSQVDEFLNNLNKPLRVVVAGGFNAGKSAFLNALIRRELMPVFGKRTTGTANYLLANSQQEFTIVWHNGDEEVRKYSSEEALRVEITYLMKEDQERIKRIEIGCPKVTFLEKFTLIDTPGLDYDKRDSAISEKEVISADILIWVLPYKGAENNDKECIARFHETHPKSPIIIILNKIDNLGSEDDLLEVISKLDRDFFGIVTKVFPFSAKLSLQGMNEKNEKKQAASRFYDLNDYLHNTVFNEFRDLQKNIRFKQNSIDLLTSSDLFMLEHDKELEIMPNKIMDKIEQSRTRYVDEKAFINKQLKENLEINPESHCFHESAAAKGHLVNILKHTHALLNADEQWSQGEKDELWGQINRITKSKFRIGVFGSFSSGKSTLINTLLGVKCLLPVDEDRCTSAYTIIKKDDSENPAGTIRINWKSIEQVLEDLQDNLQELAGESLGDLPHFKDNDQLFDWIDNNKKKFNELYEKLSDQEDWKWGDEKIAQHQELVALLKAVPNYKNIQNIYQLHNGQLTNLMANKEAVSLVNSLIFYQNHPLLQHAEIIDSPGSGSVNLTDTYLARKLVLESDALLFLTEAMTPFSKPDEVRLLNYVVENERAKNQIFYLATKTDLSKKPLDEIKRKVVDRLNRVFKREEDNPKIYMLSCETGENVKEFLKDLNGFLQEEKDHNFLDIVQSSTDKILNNLLSRYENQLNNKQLDIK